jgi:Fur family ferric uptake transcriptional regulator
MTAQAEKKFHDYVSALGLKATRQREVIAREFLAHKGHLSAEALLERVRTTDKRISLATVYRTLKLLEESGLASSHRFSDEHALFEAKPEDESHHDHLICLKCGLIIEFVDAQIERLQDKVALKHKFSIQWHRLELYGHCSDCRE